MERVVAGIDFSITSPALVIGKQSADKFDDLRFYGFAQKKKHHSWNNVVLFDYPIYDCNEERFYKISEMLVATCLENGVTDVFIEEYGFGASGGSKTQLSEATGSLLQALWIVGLRATKLSISTIKKEATGKGNADKLAMYSAYRSAGNPDLGDMIGASFDVDAGIVPSPVNDLVDAYWVRRSGINHLLRTSGNQQPS